MVLYVVAIAFIFISNLLPLVLVLIMLILTTSSFTLPLLFSYKKYVKRTNSLALEVLLAKPQYLKAFIKYCVKEFSTEKPLFYGDIAAFRISFTQTKDDREKEELVMKIYHKYMTEDSVLQLNLPHQVLQPLAEKITLKQFSDDIYNDAMNHILSVMEDDSYCRFIRSNEYSKVASLDVL